MRRKALPAFFAILAVIGSSAEAADLSRCARVIDGDTINIRNQRIRIAAIDACERDQTGLKDGKVWRCGVAARSYLANMIDGQHVRCDIIDEDQYRRLVGQCFIGDIDIGLAMVKAGMAEAMLRYLPASHSISEVEYGQAENGARDSDLGIWSAEIESPHVYRRSKSDPGNSQYHAMADLLLCAVLLHIFRRIAGRFVDIAVIVINIGAEFAVVCR